MAFIAFHKSVRGYQHLQSGTVMQDCSGSWSSPDGRFHIAVTADGHGDRLCARSDRGASFAVKAAMDALRSFADTYSGNIQEISERLSLERRSDLTGLYPSPLMTHLARCIVSGWRRMVLEDAGRSPLSMWEKLIMSDVPDIYHLYVTTLLAALVLDGKYLLLLQQGDGHAAVFSGGEGGGSGLCCSFGEIPWDPRCRGNITTSMCSADAAAGIRWSVADLSRRRLIAVFLGSDGIEDSYPRNRAGGTHDFYRALILSAILLSWQHGLGQSGREAAARGIEEHLGRFLPGLSENGSGDDVTVSGLIDANLAESRSLITSGGISLPICCVTDPGSLGPGAVSGEAPPPASAPERGCAVSLFLERGIRCSLRELIDGWCIPAAACFCDLQRNGRSIARPDRRMFVSGTDAKSPGLVLEERLEFPCGSIPDLSFTAPELLDGSASGSSSGSDCYTLAVFLFAALFGCLPYDGAELLRKPCVLREDMTELFSCPGKFVFSDGSNGVDSEVDPDASGLWDRLPHDIREMFLDVFARPGNRRPSAAEWLRAMAFLRNRYDPLTRTFASPQLLLTMMRTDRCAGHSCEHSTGHRNMAIAMGEGGSVPVTDGTAIYSCMLSSDDDTSSAAARISGSPESGFCLTNTSERAFQTLFADGERNSIEPGKSAELVPGMEISVSGRVMAVFAVH